LEFLFGVCVLFGGFPEEFDGPLVVGDEGSVVDGGEDGAFFDAVTHGFIDSKNLSCRGS
jgi:hypothetical protein